MNSVDNKRQIRTKFFSYLKLLSNVKKITNSFHLFSCKQIKVFQVIKKLI